MDIKSLPELRNWKKDIISKLQTGISVHPWGKHRYVTALPLWFSPSKRCWLLSANCLGRLLVGAGRPSYVPLHLLRAAQYLD